MVWMQSPNTADQAHAVHAPQHPDGLDGYVRDVLIEAVGPLAEEYLKEFNMGVGDIPEDKWEGFFRAFAGHAVERAFGGASDQARRDLAAVMQEVLARKIEKLESAS